MITNLSWNLIFLLWKLRRRFYCTTAHFPVTVASVIQNYFGLVFECFVIIITFVVFIVIFFWGGGGPCELIKLWRKYLQ